MSDYYYLKRTVTQTIKTPISSFSSRYLNEQDLFCLNNCRYSNPCSGFLNLLLTENFISVMAGYQMRSILKQLPNIITPYYYSQQISQPQICIFRCVLNRNVFGRKSSPRELSKNQCIIYRYHVFRRHLALISQGC